MSLARTIYSGLVDRGVVSEEALCEILEEASSTNAYPETLLREKGIPKHELLRCISEYYKLPFQEFHEGLLIPEAIASRLDLQALKGELWVPLSVNRGEAMVLVSDPQNDRLDETIKGRLAVERLKKTVALPTDIVRIIEHNQDVNPGFPPSAHRTIQAELRTRLADIRTLMAGHRTSMAKGRTGLAMMRTGLAFKAVILAMIKILGISYFLIPALIGIPLGLALFIQGLLWYLPVRSLAKTRPSYSITDSTFGSSILEMLKEGERIAIHRCESVKGADALRMAWNRLSPVMKRRFLAIDRTDLAEERTALASHRSFMAQGRTGLAFARTGISFIGLGIGLWRQFPLSGTAWIAFYSGLILVGTLMSFEGFLWYVRSRESGKKGLEIIESKQQEISIWHFMYKLFREELDAGELPTMLVIGESHLPGIWGTTGLALERTLIAERRNVKARLRTIMARSRTGMAMIRTGAKIFIVGFGLLAYFGAGNTAWTIGELALMLLGLLLVVDGFSWHLPAERTRREFPYCAADMEILIPDYSIPTQSWNKVVFSHDEP